MVQATQQPSQQARERSLRRALGIPDDAARVLILAESSHWDPNWLHTSEEYFGRWVCGNLTRAIDALLHQPRRIYSVECMFFLRMYWERQPAQRDKIRELVNEGRLRLTSSGVTTADTLLPRSEAILRDLLLGQEWLRANGMTQEPRLAYFTDSFGCSPALPSLLRAAGFDMAAITRVDGMYFLGTDYESAKRFPRAGSSAELLMKEERTLDFVWRGVDGAEVLCHWNAFGYGQGDMLAHRGLSRVYLLPLAGSDRSPRHVAHRIEHFVCQLAPYSRTPYLFCPIGMDFVGPIPDLVDLLDGYNRTRYRTTGTWVLNAGLDDYLALVDCHRGRLPALEMDPNPYWTGFYTSRPTLKKQCHDLVDLLLLAERLALRPENRGAEQGIARELEDAWWVAATANHHDFITGTSPDRVVEREQRPWLERSIRTAAGAMARLTPAGTPTTKPLLPGGGALPRWRREGQQVEIRTPYCTALLDERAGGTIVGAWHPDTRRPPPVRGVDLVCYRDRGGLWRMGHEFRGGLLKEVGSSRDRPARLEICELAGGLEVSCAVSLAGQMIRRRLWFSSRSPLIRLRVEGRAADGHTVTVRLATDAFTGQIAMDAPGGVVVRPRRKVYDPTFWPVQRFWHIHTGSGGPGVAVCLGLPGAIACWSLERAEVIALRNATRERAWGWLPIPATPASGHERRSHAFECGLLCTAAGDWRDNDLPWVADCLAESPWDTSGLAGARELAGALVGLSRPDVQVIAAKPASRGRGIIVRLYTLTGVGLPVAVSLVGRRVEEAWLCDARERDLQRLEVYDGVTRLSMPGTIATVRLLGPECA